MNTEPKPIEMCDAAFNVTFVKVTKTIKWHNFFCFADDKIENRGKY